MVIAHCCFGDHWILLKVLLLLQTISVFNDFLCTKTFLIYNYFDQSTFNGVWTNTTIIYSHTNMQSTRQFYNEHIKYSSGNSKCGIGKKPHNLTILIISRFLIMAMAKLRWPLWTFQSIPEVLQITTILREVSSYRDKVGLALPLYQR